jgi:hypothetical protein
MAPITTHAISTNYNTLFGLGFRFMMFNATFHNISAISWQSILLVEETGVPGKNHHAVSSTPCHEWVRTHNISGKSTDCTGSCKSNYYTITTTPSLFVVNKSVKSI